MFIRHYQLQRNVPNILKLKLIHLSLKKEDFLIRKNTYLSIEGCLQMSSVKHFFVVEVFDLHIDKRAHSLRKQWSFKDFLRYIYKYSNWKWLIYMININLTDSFLDLHKTFIFIKQMFFKSYFHRGFFFQNSNENIDDDPFWFLLSSNKNPKQWNATDLKWYFVDKYFKSI